MRFFRTRAIAIVSIVLLMVLFIATYFAITSYVGALPKVKLSPYKGEKVLINYPATKFAVLSDLHFYDTSLGTSGAAFEEVLRSDRKSLVESEELLDFAIRDIVETGVDFVLVSGDLTKDGEVINHLGVAAKLEHFMENGIKVYVTPGNHDIYNFHAEEYIGDIAESVANTSITEFREIYSNMGYGEALMSDPNSLSYVAEPIEGLWLLAIDACRYEDNSETGEGSVVGGRIRQEQADWLAGVLQEALYRQKAVIALMHHGVVEHWNGQAKLHSAYLVEDFRHFAAFLTSYQVNILFSGHYHAQNIAMANYDGNTIYDIETGSLVTYPCPLRYCNLAANTLTVDSKMIGPLVRPGTDFAKTAQDWVWSMVAKEAEETLLKYKVSQNDAMLISSAVADAFVVHYSGEVDSSERVFLDESKLSLWGRVVFMTQGYVLEGLWEESAPPNNKATIKLK